MSDLPWVHELIEADRHALVVPVDAVAVAAAIERVLSDDALATRLASDGRALVEAQRDSRVEMDRLAHAYRALVR